MLLPVNNISHLRDVIAATNKPIRISLWDGRIILAKNYTFKKSKNGTEHLRGPNIGSLSCFLEDNDQLENLIFNLLELYSPFITRIHIRGIPYTLRWTIENAIG